ncbi:hypothetical protein COLSTE_00893 [Collinsella stercoris DSM 13279]|uniref:Uncharacterized protein n=1 Tax=Collinsella stercoris DSM 13279 TaxID=445975 RepID=B6GA02_9ACTN|nr:hypothetical protein COLSTE_00893 [Collinsella stercoris DSM 13279]
MKTLCRRGDFCRSPAQHSRSSAASAKTYGAYHHVYLHIYMLKPFTGILYTFT